MSDYNHGEISPSLSEFLRLSARHNPVGIHLEVLAEHLTPVAACASLTQDGPGYLLESVVGGDTWGRYSIVGFEPEAFVRGAGDRFELVRGEVEEVRLGVDPWAELKQQLRLWNPAPQPGLPRFWGGAVGYVAYDMVRRFEPTVGPALREEGIDDFCFALGGPVVVFDNLKHSIRVVVPARLEASRSAESVYYEASDRIAAVVKRLCEPPPVELLAMPQKHDFAELPSSTFTHESFCDVVRRVQQAIRQGEVFQVVPSQRFTLPSRNEPLLNVYRRLRSLNPSPYMYYLNFPRVRVAGASPETLVRLTDRHAELRPIAGTRPRGRSPEEDERIAAELLRDQKELAEHVMLIDLGRNDLGRVCETGSVELNEQMGIERYSHVMHIVSNVQGVLEQRHDALDLLQSAFPAGTLSGAPKVRAMQLIDAFEPGPRGIYGGAIGYLSYQGNMDMAIAIRTVVERLGRLSVQAGAGIVLDSHPSSEYWETVNKAKAALIACGWNGSY